MKVTFPPAPLKDALNDDPEFRIAARYWDGVIEFRVGEAACSVILAAGEVVQVADGPAASGAEAVVISAPVSDWAQLLEPEPRPFYQDYYSAQTHHGFELSGDMGTLWAYYAAVRRTTDLLRRVAIVEGD